MVETYVGGRGGGIHSSPPSQERVGGMVFKRKQLTVYRRTDNADKTTMTGPPAPTHTYAQSNPFDSVDTCTHTVHTYTHSSKRQLPELDYQL